MAYQIGHAVLLLIVLITSIYALHFTSKLLESYKHITRPAWVDTLVGTLVFIISVASLTWVVVLIE